jgi:outer membrane murein-binding lipoprotein Lpp
MNYLEQLAELKAQIAQLEAGIESFMPDAIVEALNIVGNNSAANGKSIVYQVDKTKIVLVFRKKYDRDFPKLLRIDQDILDETLNIQEKNADRIQQIASAIEQLQLAIAELEEESTQIIKSPYLSKLRGLQFKVIEQITYLSPSLSVYLPKE